jgi:hypothetical protein
MSQVCYFDESIGMFIHVYPITGDLIFKCACGEKTVDKRSKKKKKKGGNFATFTSRNEKNNYKKIK